MLFRSNAVDGYAQEDLAKSSEVDFLYQEVWSESKYSDLKRIIDYGFIKSNYEKSMILAAYMNYGSRQQDGVFNTSSVLLTDATIFASGGAHLELGDAGMLSSEYFPSNNLKMSSDLKSKLRDYYDFLVAYQNLLRDNIKNTIVKTEIIGVESSTFGTGDSVWTFGKENNDYLMIHLINLLGNDNDWRDDNQDKNTPELLTNRIFKVYLDYDIKSVQLASPDFNNGIPLNLNYEVGEDESGIFISFILPTLEYWDMIIIEK